MCPSCGGGKLRIAYNSRIGHGGKGRCCHWASISHSLLTPVDRLLFLACARVGVQGVCRAPGTWMTMTLCGARTVRRRTTSSGPSGRISRMIEAGSCLSYLCRAFNVSPLPIDQTILLYILVLVLAAAHLLTHRTSLFGSHRTHHVLHCCVKRGGVLSEVGANKGCGRQGGVLARRVDAIMPRQRHGA